MRLKDIIEKSNFSPCHYDLGFVINNYTRYVNATIKDLEDIEKVCNELKNKDVITIEDIPCMFNCCGLTLERVISKESKESLNTSIRFLANEDISENELSKTIFRCYVKGV